MANSTIANLMVQLGLDSKQLDDGLKGVQNKLGGFKGAVVAGLGGSLVAGVGGAVTAITGATTALAGTIAPAVSLGESINAVNVVFGDASEEVLAFGENASIAVGMTNQAFAQMGAQTGAMLNNLGMTQAEAADETINLAQRAADMASIFNTDVSDAMAAIQSALKGEFNPLEKYAVTMKASTIEAKALEMGLVSSNEEMSDQAKMQATLAILYGQTDKFAGDFLNTQDGLANGMKQVTATVEDVKATIGTGLLPYLQEGAGLLKDFAVGTKEVLNSSAPMSEKMGMIGDLVGTMAGKLTEALPTIVSAASGLIIGLAQGLITALPTVMPMIIELVLGLVNSIITLVPMFLDAAYKIMVQLATGLATALPEMIPAIVEMLVSMIQVMLDNLPLFIKAGLELIIGLVTGIIEALPIIIEQLPVIVETIFQVILDSLPLIIDAAIMLVIALVDGIIAMLPSIALAATTIIMQFIAFVLKVLPQILLLGTKLVVKIVEGLKQSLSKLKSTGAEMMEGFKQGVMSKFQDIKNSVIGFGKDVIAGFKDLLGINSPSVVMMGFGKNMMLGLERGISKYADLPQLALQGSVSGVAIGRQEQEQSMSIPTANEIGRAVAIALMQTGMVT